MKDERPEIQLPTLMFFQNGNGWKGSSGLLCFQVEPAQGEEEKELPACVWCGPFCRELSQLDDSARFPLSEEGLAALTGWLRDWAARMNEHPTRTPQETRAYRDSVRRGEQGGA